MVDAIAATLPGASWQRCRTHVMRNLLTRVPKSAQTFVATMVRTIFAQPDAAIVRVAEQNDEWAVASRGYMSGESLAKALAEPVDERDEVTAIAAAA